MYESASTLGLQLTAIWADISLGTFERALPIAELTATAVVVVDIPIESIDVRVHVVVEYGFCSVQPDFLSQAVADLSRRKHVIPTY